MDLVGQVFVDKKFYLRKADCIGIINECGFPFQYILTVKGLTSSENDQLQIERFVTVEWSQKQKDMIMMILLLHSCCFFVFVFFSDFLIVAAISKTSLF